MQPLIRSNDPVELSFAQSLLSDAGIPCVLLDQHTSVLEGSIGAIPRRLCVADDDLDKARALLVEAGLAVALGASA
ncbi:MAG: putative signal transducing protein [Niveispirillum sp.]|uniref:putative signal transducing protein n=1 Tax=Niveispirillum sp. TaxID=1917217 RepID=UPI0040357E1F